MFYFRFLLFFFPRFIFFSFSFPFSYFQVPFPFSHFIPTSSFFHVPFLFFCRSCFLFPFSFSFVRPLPFFIFPSSSLHILFFSSSLLFVSRSIPVLFVSCSIPVLFVSRFVPLEYYIAVPFSFFRCILVPSHSLPFISCFIPVLFSFPHSHPLFSSISVLFSYPCTFLALCFPVPCSFLSPFYVPFPISSLRFTFISRDIFSCRSRVSFPFSCFYRPFSSLYTSLVPFFFLSYIPLVF